MHGEEPTAEGGWLRLPDGRTFAELTVAEKGAQYHKTMIKFLYIKFCLEIGPYFE